MKNCPVLLLAACALVAASAPTFAQTGIPGLDNAIKKLERLAPSAPAQGPAAEAPTKQPTQQAPEQPTATAPTESPLDTPLPAVAPTRLTGVLGIQLGSTLGAAEAQLKQRGFQRGPGANATKTNDVHWFKGGNPTSGVNILLDGLGRVAYISYSQSFTGDSGQFDIDDVGTDLIKRFGQPIHDRKTNVGVFTVRNMAFSEGDSTTKQNIKLSVSLGPPSLVLSFGWDALSFQADRVLAAKEKARADSVPKVKANVQ